MVFSSIIKPSKDIVGSWGLGTGILHLLIFKGMAKPKTEEGIVELLVLLLRHHMPEEGIHLRRGGEKTKVSWELWVGRIGRGEKVTENRGSFHREVANSLRIKWWATALSTALMRK